LFKRVERGSLVEEVASQIRELVLEGRLRPDQRLPPQQELCEQFGVSRTCVREALRLLEGYGLLESRSGGTFVRSHADASRALLQIWGQAHEYSLEEFLEVFMALEGTAAALAARHATLPAVEAIGQALGAMRRAADEEDWDGLLGAELAFHDAIYAASRNRLLGHFAKTLNGMPNDLRRTALSVPERKDRMVALHGPIHEAIERRDPQAARQAMEEAIRDFGREFRVFPEE
jgi:GntR family transcriptional repressor for pyruvate dehydrogenase complex